MKNLKPGQLATLINKNLGIGCIIKVTKQKNVNINVCPECKKSNYKYLCGWTLCPMLFFEKSCTQTIPEASSYPKIIKSFEV